MTRWTVAPGGGLKGRLRVPGDKSISHRALLLGALAAGPGRARGVAWGEDVEATARALTAFGVTIETDGEETRIVPPERLVEPDRVIDCGNSGTTLRLLTGIAAAEPLHVVLTGDDSLRSRPMRRVVDPLRRMGAHIDGRDGGERAPLAIRGGPLEMVQHALPVASAQVKSAILLAGLRSGVAVQEPMHSRDHTERMLVAMGASLRRTPEGWLVLLPTPRLEPLVLTIPGDLSSAAFLLVAAAITEGSELYLDGVGVNPTRTGVLDVLEAMGADIQVFPTGQPGPEPVADLLVRSGPLVGTRIAGELALRSIDELPVLAVAAAFAEGETRIADAAELRVKESDRIAAVVEALRAIGVEVEEHPDGLLVRGGRPRGGATVDARGDHRIAMAFAVAGLATREPVRIEGAQAARTSYPDFRQTLEAHRG